MTEKLTRLLYITENWNYTLSWRTEFIHFFFSPLHFIKFNHIICVSSSFSSPSVNNITFFILLSSSKIYYIRVKVNKNIQKKILRNKEGVLMLLWVSFYKNSKQVKFPSFSFEYKEKSWINYEKLVIFFHIHIEKLEKLTRLRVINFFSPDSSYIFMREWSA